MALIITALLWGTAFLSALDRVAMSVALLPLSEEFGLSETIKGSIFSLFSVGYGLAILPSGLLAGSLSPRIMMGTGLAVWSLATILTPLATSSSLGALLAVRAVVGVAESVIMPTTQRLVSSWIPPQQKSFVIATILSGFQAGTIAAYLASPMVMDELGGWRELFLVYGAIGLVWLVPWMTLARDAPNTPEVESSIALRSEIKLMDDALEDSLQFIKSAPWTEFAKSPAVWSMTLAHAANNWGLYNSLAWTPTFYAEQYGLNVKDSALLSVLPSVAGAVGGLIAGLTADALIRNLGENADTTTTRKIYQGIALFGPAVCLATLASHIPEQPWVAQTLLGLGLGLQAFNAAGYVAANQEKAGEKWTGLLYSITSLPGVMVGSFGVYLTGQILDVTQQDWSAVFGLTAVVNALGATAFVLSYNSKREFD
jgi:MFS transporter, ACS family, solute carrier family 17 (sodium-dependent inorganic phosphate cotransporter), other